MPDNNTIPFIDLKPIVRAVGPREVVDDFIATLGTCEFINAPVVEEFEAALAKYLGVEHVVACANGTDALVLALMAAGIGPGHRVAIPNLTFWATYEAVKLVGADAVLIDIDTYNFQMSYTEFTARAQRGSMAVGAHAAFDAAILVHLFGHASEQTSAFRMLCRQWHIPLIEDAAQAIGIRLGRQPLLADADYATLSFHPAKVLGGIMDGGAVVVKSERDAWRLRQLRNHGRGSGHYEHVRVGTNSRMSAVNAAYLVRALARLDDTIAARRKMLGLYERLLPARMTPQISDNGYLCITTVDNPAVVSERLTAAGIGHARIYPRTIAEQAGYTPTDRDHVALNLSRAFCKRVINLPLYYGIPAEHVRAAAKAFVEAAR